jgi:undecaprenyl-diphosphatase
MPILVAVSRMFRGEHHPTDLLGSLLFAALWLTAVTLLIRPHAPNTPLRAGKPGPGDRASATSWPAAGHGQSR